MQRLSLFPKHGRENTPTHWWIKGILAVACFGCVAFIIYGMVTHRHRFIVDPIVPLSVASLIWWCQGRDCAVKRALGRTDRLEIVDELVRRNLVSPEEAAALRTAIERLFEYK